MENRDFKEGLLKDKKKKFKLAVMESADKLGVKQPVVKFWECPYQQYSPDEIAHCHHDNYMICISERRLEQRTDEQIMETATHEVTHLKHPDHSDSFHNTHQELMASSWRPPTGVGITAFSESDLQKIKHIKHKPSKPDKKHCNYFQVTEHTKGKLEQCKYCERYFCSEHIKARPAGLKNFNDYNKLSQDLQEEANNKNAHPCIGYNEHFQKMAKEQNERYGEALDRLLITRGKRYASMHTPSTKIHKSYDYEEKDNYPATANYWDEEDEKVEMYNPHGRKITKSFHSSHTSYKTKRFFRHLFSFSLDSEIKGALTQFCIALLIGLGLDYVYYQNFSLHYLFIGGVQDWFSALIELLNNGIGGGYYLFYVVINGLFYYYLFSNTVKLVYAIITNLNKKGTVMFLVGVTVLLFITFKYFPNMIY